ncbi:ABC transporter substrate-binding protein [Candidatus Microgenomates bacterium]|nr:ABC transporter substrate-binding protein [Candidatus Microgenomates bacterium]
MRLFKNIRLGVILAITYIRAHWYFFLIGLALALALFFLGPNLQSKQIETVGFVGDYTVSNLPLSIQKEISFGLTTVQASGEVAPGVAKSWVITDSGRTVTFALNTSLRWQNGESVSADSINYNLKSVLLTRPAPDQIRLALKEPFAPLLTVVSQPLFKNGLVGLGRWRVDGVNFNGRFVQSLTLSDSQSGLRKLYKFYPDEKSVTVALKLGAINKAIDLHNAANFQTDSHYQVESRLATTTLATLFFNLEKNNFDDKSFRQGLIYALPDQFSQGEAVDSPIPQGNWAKTVQAKKYPQNFDLAKKLLSSSASKSAQIKITIQTIPELEDVAKQIVTAWQKAGITTTIQVTDVPDPTFDTYLAFMELPTDPDQYLLWHSTQPTNISHYKSPKVDKLLEEGRRTLDEKERKSIYADFQRALTEDAPAAFLFYPKLYTITRK